jgi:HD-like signal output (HDOD) protein
MSLGRDTIITLGTSLPPSLGVFGRLQALLRNPDTDLDQIVQLVQIDPALTFQIIKLANSALFGLRHRSDSLEEAVSRIGFGDIHQLVGLAVSRQVCQGGLKQYGLASGRLWENAVAIGALDAALAAAAGVDAQNAYATGLLRSIGKIILNNYAGAVSYPGEAVHPDVHAWEKTTHGISAAEVSAVLLDHWRFSPESVEAVRGHHEPEAATSHVPGAARLHLACGLIVAWGCALPGESVHWRTDDEMLARAGVTSDQIPAAVEQARAKFAACAQIEWSHAA